MKFQNACLHMIIIVLVGLVTISAASAADDASSDKISDCDMQELILEETISEEVSSTDDNDELVLEDGSSNGLGDSSNENAILKDGETAPGSFKDLNKLINEDFSDNVTITLNGNYKYSDGDDDFVHGIVINRGVTIDGNGFTLDGSNSARMFDVETNSEVIIKNINFINGHTSGDFIYLLSGGAILFGADSEYANNKVINCNFTNNTAENDGGAICGFYSGVAINCIFIQNTAKIVYSGALHHFDATNCTFIQNTAKYGGAITDSTAINCTFINNTAQDSGAMFIGTAVLCRFVEDSDTTSDTNIVTPAFSVSDLTTVYHSGDKLLFNLTANNVNYDGFDAEIKIFKGESLIKTIHALSGNNNGWLVDLPIGTYKAELSIVSHPDVEPADATLTVTTDGTTFTDLNELINGNSNDTITLDKNYTYNPATDSAFTKGININRQITINGNGHTIDAKGQARIFSYVEGDNVTINNVTFVNGKYYSNGGAIYWRGYNGMVSGCSFINNTANVNGGAIYWSGGNGCVFDCIFLNNTADGNGGAIFWNARSGCVSDCVFINNTANDGDGGAICWYGGSGCVFDCVFLNNTAGAWGVIYAYGDLNMNHCWFGNTADNYDSSPAIGGRSSYDNWLFLNATANPNEVPAFSTSEIVFKLYLYNKTSTTGNISEYDNTLLLPINLTVTSTNGDVDIHTVNLGDSIRYTATSRGTGSITASIENVKYTIETTNLGLNPDLSVDSQEADYSNRTIIAINYNSSATGTVNITLKGKNGNNYAFTNFVLNATILLPEVINADEYDVNVAYSGDNVFLNANATGTLTVNKANSTLTINDNVTFDYNTNGSTTVFYTNASGVNASVMGQPNAIVVVNDTTITVSGLNAGNYTLTVTTITDANHNNITKNATITVNKLQTQLSGNAITATYNINKDLVITLKDANGNAVSGVKITVDLNGAKTYTTDKNGQIKVSTKGLAPKAYTAKVTFNGNTNYDKSTKDVKVTVKKTTPKLTAKKKTFKTSVKTKKYTITLKDNTGKAIKKAKVTLKVKGKTYKATTNSKGKAVFKIKNLKKKGTFKATITYKGNKYYNKVSKKAKIKVIVTFKTVSKGSKDKSTVKEIQQALKDHGYYISYKGHYLKVDGKFQSCTERSVKEFQKDKGLKVTGKVDEKTAKKLGLI